MYMLKIAGMNEKEMEILMSKVARIDFSNEVAVCVTEYNEEVCNIEDILEVDEIIETDYRTNETNYKDYCNKYKGLESIK